MIRSIETFILDKNYENRGRGRSYLQINSSINMYSWVNNYVFQVWKKYNHEFIFLEISCEKDVIESSGIQHICKTRENFKFKIFR